MFHWHDPDTPTRTYWKRPHDKPTAPACDRPECEPKYPQPTPASAPIADCPRCGNPLVMRTRRSDGKSFLGCSMYPDCTHTQPITADVMMRTAGADTLPGFD